VLPHLLHLLLAQVQFHLHHRLHHPVFHLHQLIVTCQQLQL
jgi:hypothetical protein